MMLFQQKCLAILRRDIAVTGKVVCVRCHSLLMGKDGSEKSSRLERLRILEIGSISFAAAIGDVNH